MTTANADARLNRQQVTDDNWVDRYLLGHLSESESMAFEDYYASCPDTMAELETSALLIDGLKAGDENSTSIFSAKPAKQAGTSAPSNTRVMGSWHGMAASFVAGAALLFASGQYISGGDSGTEGVVAYVNVPVVTLGPSRGSDRGIAIEANDAQRIVLALDVGFDPAPSYTASLKDDGGNLMWQSDELQPNSTQMLTMSLTGGLLPAGDYQIVVRPTSGSGSALLYSFSIS